MSGHVQRSSHPETQPAPRGRVADVLNLTLLLLSGLALVVVFNFFAQRPEWRARIDATKTRAYSLSEQTRVMLRGFDGTWTIALVFVEQEADRAVRRQVDEVLARFTAASPHIEVMRIDPTDVGSLGEYEALLARLRQAFAEPVAEYEKHIAAGRAAFENLLVFADQQAGRWEQILQHGNIDPEGAAMAGLIQRVAAVGLLAEQGAEVLEEVDRLLRTSDARPIPDYDAARSVLHQALALGANEIYETGEMYGRWVAQEEIPLLARQHMASVRRDHETEARRLAAAADPLKHLPPLELASIGRELARGEAAIILAPEGPARGPRGRAAVVPWNQLVPRSNIRQTRTGGVVFDQRFRGEQILAAAMRSLLVEHMPKVVFLHAEDRSLLRPRDGQIDLTGVASTLNASRYDVDEWIAGAGERPTAERGQPVVYIVIPPPRRSGLEPSGGEMELIQTAQRLIDDGEPVLLSMYPSLLPRYGQADPWASLAEPLGVRVDTARVVYERHRTAAHETRAQRGQPVQRFDSRHPIGRALQGQQAYFNLPMVVSGAEPRDDSAPAPGGHEQDSPFSVLASIAPAANRWLEPEWSADPDTVMPPEDGTGLNEPAPIAVAVQRAHPMAAGGSRQRAIVIGSGGWMLTYVADVGVGIGGDRVARVNPGNHELMLASVAWLAGMDELIAQSPAGQEVARLGEIPDRAMVAWFWIAVVGLPAAALGMGIVVWGVRRV